MRKGMALAFFTLIFILLFSNVAFAEEGIVETRVIATVERHLTFLYPSDQAIETGKRKTNIGVTGLKELLLYSGETLKIVLIPDREMKQVDGEGVLPWEISCEELPTAINTDGEWYVTVNVKSDDWKNAPPGSYKGVIRFEVYSSVSQELLLTQRTNLNTVVKASDVKPPIIPPKTGDLQKIAWYAGLFGLSALYFIAFAALKGKIRPKTYK